MMLLTMGSSKPLSTPNDLDRHIPSCSTNFDAHPEGADRGKLNRRGIKPLVL